MRSRQKNIFVINISGCYITFRSSSRVRWPGSDGDFDPQSRTRHWMRMNPRYSCIPLSFLKIFGRPGPLKVLFIFCIFFRFNTSAPSSNCLMNSLAIFLATAAACTSFSDAFAIPALAGAIAKSVSTGSTVDLSEFLSASAESTGDGNPSRDFNMLIFGTYAADFNAIEYAQRLRYYLPQLQTAGVSNIGLLLNCEADAAKKMVELVDLETKVSSESSPVELLIDPLGECGRKFGVGVGWRPDDEEMSPYLKLFGMLWGLGAWATLPSVIGGYLGNPFTPQPWIEDAMAVGQVKGRWPDTALELDDDTKAIKVNKFAELPYVGGWQRRPLELATLRLQNMVDISIKNWKDLAPQDDALNAGVLTQLGGVVIVDAQSGEIAYEWKDPGICSVANFENMFSSLLLSSPSNASSGASVKEVETSA